VGPIGKRRAKNGRRPGMEMLGLRYAAEVLGAVQVKGRDEPIEIYRLA
jgi:hypothetical protein